MLYNLHYYPLFKKDTFRPRDPLPGKEKMRMVEAQKDVAIEISPISPISTSVTPISPSTGQTEIEEEALEPPMDKLWGFASENQAMAAYKPNRNDLLSSEMSSKAPTLATSTKDSKSPEVTSFTINNEYNGGMDNKVNLKSERQPSSGHSVFVTLPDSKRSGIQFWQGAAIGALGVGLVAFGAFVAKFIFGRPGRKAAKKGRERQINISDDVFVRAKW
jgi:hypothetical protein